MNRKILVMGLITLVVLIVAGIAFDRQYESAPPIPAVTSSPTDKTNVTNTSISDFDGLSYIKARKLILEDGWQPFKHCSTGITVSEKTCKLFPEIDSCSNEGYCGMKFAKENQCLIVSTINYPPDQEEGTRVEEVSIANSPCITN